MADANPVKCPFCGSQNPVGSAFCQDCGKKFSAEPPAQTMVKTDAYQSPPLPNYQPPDPSRSHRSRNIMITVVAGVLIASLMFAAIMAMAPINNNNSQATPTPSATAAPTKTATATPTAIPTQAPRFTPLPTPQPPNNTITAINLQFVYQSTDQNYFGPTAQTLSFTNQPNGMLSLNQGQEFWYSFKLTAGTSALPDSIDSISVSTPGFSIVSVNPAPPITFTKGSSITITVHLQSPQSSFEGAPTLILTTSG